MFKTERQLKELREERELEHPDVPAHNNYVENLIRPFSQGRRVWLFANNPHGARASANLYSLVSTARANGLEPFAYLSLLFERLPPPTPSRRSKHSCPGTSAARCRFPAAPPEAAPAATLIHPARALPLA